MCTQPCYFGGPFALNVASDDEDLLDVTVATLKSRMANRALTLATTLRRATWAPSPCPATSRRWCEAAAGLGGGKGARKSKIGHRKPK